MKAVAVLWKFSYLENCHELNTSAQIVSANVELLQESSSLVLPGMEPSSLGFACSSLFCCSWGGAVPSLKPLVVLCTAGMRINLGLQVHIHLVPMYIHMYYQFLPYENKEE